MLNHRMGGCEHDFTVHPVLIHRERWNRVDLVANGNRGEIRAGGLEWAHRFIAKPAGELNRSMYLSPRPINSARFKPMALTRMRTWPGPASGTSISLNFKTSGPPACENSMTRDI